MVGRMESEVFTNPREAPAGGLKPELLVLQARPFNSPELTPVLSSWRAAQRSQRTGSGAILPCQLNSPSFRSGCPVARVRGRLPGSARQHSGPRVAAAESGTVPWAARPGMTCGRLGVITDALCFRREL